MGGGDEAEECLPGGGGCPPRAGEAELTRAHTCARLLRAPHDRQAWLQADRRGGLVGEPEPLHRSLSPEPLRQHLPAPGRLAPAPRTSESQNPRIPERPLPASLLPTRAVAQVPSDAGGGLVCRRVSTARSLRAWAGLAGTQAADEGLSSAAPSPGGPFPRVNG